MLHLLEVIEKILPLNPDDWDQVKYQFVKTYATNNHSVTAITSRFQSLYRTKEPTGSPNIPEEVCVAKQIRNMIIEKSDRSTGSSGMRSLSMTTLTNTLRAMWWMTMMLITSTLGCCV